MPTIDQLEAAVVAADDDVLPVSQSGITRRVSRSQLLAGMQASLALTPGLLGRTASGLGPPQQLVVGSGLTLANGVLSGCPQFSTGSLPIAATASLSDLVPISQGGQDHAIAVSGLLSTSGIDVSHQVARTGVGISRRLADWFNDAVAIEAFGAAGDGVTDDSSALSAAIASGRPILLGPKTYRVDGQWTIQTPAVLVGVAGATRLRRSNQRGGAWISVSGASFVATDVIFDAGAVAGDSWAVLLTPTCTSSVFERCTFINASGPTLGSGLTIEARDGLTGFGSSHLISECTFSNNRCHGLWVQASSGADVRGCIATDNGEYGVCLDFNDPSFEQTVRQSRVVGCRCENNARGISVGNYNETNREPPQWGLANPDAIDIQVCDNICAGNSEYGIAVSGERITVFNNTITVGDSTERAAGILCNAAVSTVESNIVVGPASFGIDSGGSADLTLCANVVQNCTIGINAGGSVRVRIARNQLISNGRAITVFQVETDGHGANFGLACSDIWIEDNLIQVDAQSSGILLFDGAERVDLVRNRFLTQPDTAASNLFWAHTDSLTVRENSLNGSPTTLAAAQALNSVIQVVFPDFLDRVDLPSALTRINGVFGTHQALTMGTISFIRVTNGGSGYTNASVVIVGHGSGATASAYIRDGTIIGIAIISSGGGYDAQTAVTIAGDGQGATALPFVGIPTSVGRRLRLSCSSDVSFPNQFNWTGTGITVPAFTEVVLTGTPQGWQATQFVSIDHVVPHPDGSVSLKSSSGDVGLCPAPGSSLNIYTTSEPVGVKTCLGRGSPEGIVVAPPGSDYRNLDGGAGMTLWIKRSGLSGSGWFAIA